MSGPALSEEAFVTMTLKKSDHFDGKRFVNPYGAAAHPFSAVPRMLLERRTPWPVRVDVLPQQPPRLDGATAVVTFIAHSTFLIQTAEGNILTDPMYSQRAGPLNLLGPRRVRQPAVRFDDLPPISMVLLSHNHYDHCDLHTLRRLAKRFDPLVVTALGNGALVRSAAIRRVEELDWWQCGDHAAIPDYPDAGAAFLCAKSAGSKSRAVGWIPAGPGPRAHILRRRYRVRPFFLRYPTTPWSDQVWRCCPSARTNHAGSWSLFT